jgi:hypothetical protein
MKTRIVHTRYWQDSFILSLDKDTRLFFLYLLSNQYINICGIYELPDQIVIMETGLTHEQLQTCKQTLEKSQKAIFYKGWVQVVNVERYNFYRNSPKNEIAYNKEIMLIPKEFPLIKGDIADTSIYTSIDTPINHKSKIINHKSKRESMQELRDKIKNF